MSINERVRLVIETVTPPTRRFVALEDSTGVKAETWRTWWNREGKPSADMIEALAKAWPEFAFWVSTGIDDFAHGHIAPNSPKERQRSAAKDYFLAAIQFEKFKLENPISEDEVEEPGTWLQHRANLAELADIRIGQEKIFARLPEKK